MKNGFDTDLFYEKTNGGLAFFEQEFASEKTKKRANGFSFDGGSCNVTKIKNGNYVFTNFKESSKGVNAIDYVMQRDGTDFVGACALLFAQFQIAGSTVATPAFLPLKTWEDSTAIAGTYDIDYFSTTKNTAIFAPFLTDMVCRDYDFFEIKSYYSIKTIVATSKTSKLTIEATENYPIFGYKCNNFTKLYEPKAQKNKDGYSSRHHFLGVKPPRHIYGWDRIKEAADQDEPESEDSDFAEYSIEDVSDSGKKDNRLDYVFICTGGSDGLNVASLGYDVIWFNSETEIINEFELNLLFKIAKNVVYIPDLDKTGIAQAAAMGFMTKKHLKIKMLFPPSELSSRGKKDIADWIREQKNETLATVQYNFKELLGQAQEFEFWDFNKKRKSFVVNNGKMIQFLHFQGFYTYCIPQMDKKTKRAIEEKIFVKITNNIIEKISPADVQIFVIDWLKKMYVPLYIQEVIYKSVFFNDNNTIKNLPKAEIDTVKTTAKSQKYFFKNTILNVFEDRIEKNSYAKNDTQIWSKNIIDRNFFEKPKATTITKTDGVFDIEIHNTDSNYLKLLINTSRFYWAKDADENQNDTNEFGITSKNLTEVENLHQKNELINKMFCLGYLLHEHKIKPKSYMVIGTDHKIGKSSKDNKGGSGKSAIISGLYSLIPNHYERNGRELNKDTERFKYTDIDDEVRLLHFDEMNMYFDLSKFFTDITADVTANWKGGKMVYIPFEFFTKLAITMNAVPQEITDSHSRRTLDFETSDFYHIKNEEYAATRQVSDSFNGQTLWSKDYKVEDWQLDDNFLIECLQFYLGNDKKIEVDGQNLMRRNKIQQIGDREFKFLTQFFDDFADPETAIADTEDLQFVAKQTGYNWINKGKIYDLYKEEVGKFAKSLQDFKDCLKLFFFENPIEFAKQKTNGTGKTVEHFRFLTPKTDSNEAATTVETTVETTVATKAKASDELPF